MLPPRWDRAARCSNFLMLAGTALPLPRCLCASFAASLRQAVYYASVHQGRISIDRNFTILTNKNTQPSYISGWEPNFLFFFFKSSQCTRKGDKSILFIKKSFPRQSADKFLKNSPLLSILEKMVNLETSKIYPFLMFSLKLKQPQNNTSFFPLQRLFSKI